MTHHDEHLSILHAPLNIANDPWALSRGQRALGVHADLAAIAASPLVESPDVDLVLSGLGPVRRQYRKARFVHAALRDYDVFHYSYGRSILDYGESAFRLMDMKLAHQRHRCVAMTFHGCDVRWMQPDGCLLCDPCRVSASRSRIEQVLSMADLVYVTTPDLLDAVPSARFLPQSVWGVGSASSDSQAPGDLVRIVHAPSHRGVKGTTSLIAACDRLVSEGYPVELVLVEGVQHADALKIYATADLVVDQLRAGWYGVFSIEAAMSGKPVVTHIARRFVEATGMAAPPFVDATEDSIYYVLRELTGQRERLTVLGRECRDFAIRRHSAVVNAERTVADYMSVLTAKSNQFQPGQRR